MNLLGVRLLDENAVEISAIIKEINKVNSIIFRILKFYANNGSF